MKKLKLFDTEYKQWPRQPGQHESCPNCRQYLEAIDQESIYWDSETWYCNQNCHDEYIN